MISCKKFCGEIIYAKPYHQIYAPHMRPMHWTLLNYAVSTHGHGMPLPLRTSQPAIFWTCPSLIWHGCQRFHRASAVMSQIVGWGCFSVETALCLPMFVLKSWRLIIWIIAHAQSALRLPHLELRTASNPTSEPDIWNLECTAREETHGGRNMRHYRERQWKHGQPAATVPKMLW